MTNSQDHNWLETSLRFWQNVKPSRKITKARIEWEIEHLSRWLRECAA